MQNVAVGECYGDVIKGLEKLGIKVTAIPSSDILANPERCHADLQLLHLGGSCFAVSDKNSIFCGELTKFGANFVVTENKLDIIYPKNILLNFIVTDKKIIGNMKYIDKNLKSYIDREGIIPIHVNQGYAKCSTAVVGENSFITSDITIANALQKQGLNILKINPGHIEMPGYDYGFIGGCCALIDKNTLVFTGDIKKHPNYIEIKSFLKNLNVDFISLAENKLLDVGGIIPITCL